MIEDDDSFPFSGNFAETEPFITGFISDVEEADDFGVIVFTVDNRLVCQIHEKHPQSELVKDGLSATFYFDFDSFILCDKSTAMKVVFITPHKNEYAGGVWLYEET